MHDAVRAETVPRQEVGVAANESVSQVTRSADPTEEITHGLGGSLNLLAPSCTYSR